MKTIIFTIKYNLDTNFSQNLSFSALREKCPNTEFFLVRIWALFTLCRHMIFCIERQLFCKVGINSLVCVSHQLSLTGNSSCDFFPQEILFLGKERYIVYSENWLLTVVLQRYFYYWGKRLYLQYVFFFTFCSQNLVFADSPEKFCVFFSSLVSTSPENTSILSGILNVYSKTKKKYDEEQEVFLQKQQKGAAKFSLPPQN